VNVLHALTTPTTDTADELRRVLDQTTDAARQATAAAHAAELSAFVGWSL
jgi:hypothetical protein